MMIVDRDDGGREQEGRVLWREEEEERARGKGEHR